MAERHVTPAVVIGGLNLIRCFQGSGIPVISVPGSQQDVTRYSRLFRSGGVTIADLRENGDSYFLEKLVAIASEAKDTPVLYYGRDEVLSFISRQQDVLQRHFRLLMPPPETLLACLDKHRFQEFARTRDLPVPRGICSTPQLRM